MIRQAIQAGAYFVLTVKQATNCGSVYAPDEAVFETAECLLKFGANPNAINDVGFRPRGFGNDNRALLTLLARYGEKSFAKTHAEMLLGSLVNAHPALFSNELQLPSPPSLQDISAMYVIKNKSLFFNRLAELPRSLRNEYPELGSNNAHSSHLI